MKQRLCESNRPGAAREQSSVTVKTKIQEVALARGDEVGNKNQREFSPFVRKMHFPFVAHVGGTAVFTWLPYVNQIKERHFHLMIGVLTSETFWI